MARRINILFVDDEDDIRTIVELALGRDPDIDVRLAASGPAALQMLAGDVWRPDLALIDMMMPGMNGLELMAELMVNPQIGVPLVAFLTATVQPSDIESYLDAGAIAVLPKPFDPLTLATEIRSWIGATRSWGDGG
jgi:CheY-like chemotaxis protein